MIPQCSPVRAYQALKAEIDQAIQRVLDSGWYILGEEVAAFEAEFAQANGSARAIGVANGTDAIEVALRALGVGPGDQVITVSHTAVATAAAVARTGASPVLVDVDDTQTMSVRELEQLLADDQDYAAIIVVHLYGLPADISAIMEMATLHGVPVIEDCAQAHFAEVDGQRVGTFGSLGCFSFYPTKNLGALGDGGLIVTDDDSLADACLEQRQYGWDDKRNSQQVGVNSRLDALQAAVLRVRLRYLAELTGRRREIATLYDDNIDAPVAKPGDVGLRRHVYHQYVVRHGARDELQSALQSAGVGTGIHYPVPVHGQPAYLACRRTALETTETLAKQILSLPMFPELSYDEVMTVCDRLNTLA